MKPKIKIEKIKEQGHKPATYDDEDVAYDSQEVYGGIFEGFKPEAKIKD